MLFEFRQLRPLYQKTQDLRLALPKDELYARHHPLKQLGTEHIQQHAVVSREN